MKVLQVHCRYLTSPGGEDFPLENERLLLEKFNHSVDQFILSNSEIRFKGGVDSLKAGINSIWSKHAYRLLSEKICSFRPDIIHVHNTFAALSPSVFWAAKHSGVPVVLTIYNYRTVCAASTLLRNDKPCLECLGKYPYPAIFHFCRYRDSVMLGYIIAFTQSYHRFIKTYQACVDGFIAQTEFVADILVQSGIKKQKVYIKPNFLWDNSDIDLLGDRFDQFIYVGQITSAKGVELIIEAWNKLDITGSKLVIVGNGPSEDILRAHTNSRADIVWKGHLSHDEVMNEIKNSKFLIMASKWFESLPGVLTEALSLGTPTIVPNHGSFPYINTPDVNAYFFNPGSISSLEEAILKANGMSENEWRKMSLASRQTFLDLYTPEKNIKMLEDIYARVVFQAGKPEFQ